ncbi:MAG: alkaline phosphatase [Saprospiraceae bacterium]
MRHLFLSMFLLWYPAQQPPAVMPSEPPHNVILLIGDGMGLTQITAGMYAQHEKLNLERFPVTGLITTHPAKEKITDSAAAGTAMACGCKTKNGMLGLTEKKKVCRNLFEQAKDHQMATGIVVTCSVVHATPAAFVSHVEKRDYKEDIAVSYLSSDIDLLIGGGRRFFNKRTDDRRDLLAELQEKGYRIENIAETPFENLSFEADKPLIWFTHDEEPLSVLEGRNYLAQASAQATGFLQQRNKNGFFLMVEGSQIDWAGHKNNADWMIAETLEFDRAVGEILRFAQADGHTLVIVTADHETGGAAITQGSTRDSLRIDFINGEHIATMVPVFAYGPGSELFNGVYDNTDIYFKIKKALGWVEE